MQFMESIKPKDHKVTFADKFFFDTNIWLLLYGTIADFQKSDQKAYSSLFSEILIKKSALYTSSLILSEFANVLLRKDFKQWVDKGKLINQDFKRDFVGTSQYKKSVSVVTNLINKILALPSLVPISDDFSSIDKKSILKRFETVDFNDSYISELVERSKTILVTNDKDFLKITIASKIITT